jgi:hypothetical protein
VKWYGNDIAAYFQMLNKASIRCSAGRDHIDVKPDGTLYRCEFFTMYPSEPSYGNLLDGTATIDLTNRYCAMGGCACKSTIGWAEPVVAEYKRVGTQHHYVRRKPGEIGQHSYDPVKPDQIVPTPQTVSLLDIDPAMDAASARAEAEDRVPIAVRR